MNELARFCIKKRDHYCDAALKWYKPYGSPKNNEQSQRYHAHYSSMQQAMNEVLDKIRDISGVDYDQESEEI